MACKRDKPEEIVAKLRQVEVLQGQGWSAPTEWSSCNVSGYTVSALGA